MFYGQGGVQFVISLDCLGICYDLPQCAKPCDNPFIRPILTSTTRACTCYDVHLPHGIFVQLFSLTSAW